MTLDDASRQVKGASEHLMRVLMHTVELGATREGVAKISDTWARESDDTNQWVTHFAAAYQDVPQDLVRNHAAEYVNILAVNMDAYADCVERLLYGRFMPGDDAANGVMNAEITKVMVEFCQTMFETILAQRRAAAAEFRKAAGLAALLAEDERNKTRIYEGDDVYPAYEAKNYDLYVLMDRFCELFTRELLEQRAIIQNIDDLNGKPQSPYLPKEVIPMAYASFGMGGWNMYVRYRDISYIYGEIMGKGDAGDYLSAFVRQNARRIKRAVNIKAEIPVNDAFFAEADAIIREISRIASSDRRALRASVHNDFTITRAICRIVKRDFVKGVKAANKSLAHLYNA